VRGSKLASGGCCIACLHAALGMAHPGEAQRAQVQVEEKRRDATPHEHHHILTPVPPTFLPLLVFMPRSNTKPVAAAKRKRPTEDAAEEVSAAFVAVANGVSERGLPDLEDSDEEGVPEIVNESGDEEDGVTGSNSDTEDDGEVGFTPDASEDESASEQGDEDDFVHGTEVSVPFPVATTVVSNITGRPKRVYPDIEPDYDSDSSTEDVRAPVL
jgi:hypothetical protein